MTQKTRVENVFYFCMVVATWAQEIVKGIFKIGVFLLCSNLNFIKSIFKCMLYLKWQLQLQVFLRKMLMVSFSCGKNKVLESNWMDQRNISPSERWGSCRQRNPTLSWITSSTPGVERALLTKMNVYKNHLQHTPIKLAKGETTQLSLGRITRTFSDDNDGFIHNDSIRLPHASYLCCRAGPVYLQSPVTTLHLETLNSQ